MAVTKHDGIMLMYNYAVVLTGGFAVLELGVNTREALFIITLIFSIVWTVYFRFGMIPKFVDHPRFAPEDEPQAEG